MIIVASPVSILLNRPEGVAILDGRADLALPAETPHPSMKYVASLSLSGREQSMPHCLLGSKTRSSVLLVPLFEPRGALSQH
jgi:hypothetical protein